MKVIAGIKGGLNSLIKLSKMNMSLTRCCGITVEEAIRIRERGSAKEVVAVVVSDKIALDPIVSALQMGVDRVMHVACKGPLTPSVYAEALRDVSVKEKADLVIINEKKGCDCSQAGPLLASRLHCSIGTGATKVLINEREKLVTIHRASVETLTIGLPALITTDPTIQPRCPLPRNLQAFLISNVMSKLLKDQTLARHRMYFGEMEGLIHQSIAYVNVNDVKKMIDDIYTDKPETFRRLVAAGVVSFINH